MLVVLAAFAFAPGGRFATPGAQQHAPVPAIPVACTKSRAGPLTARAEKKVIQAENYDSGLFEVREVDIGSPPVFLLICLERLKIPTFVADLGVLSLAEEYKVFSTLEGLGAFFFVEKTLPFVEKLRLLTIFEKSLDIPNGYLFTGAITLLTFPLNLLFLQGTSIVPFVQLPTQAPQIALEVGVDLAAVTAGAALFVMAYLVGKLQEAAAEGYD